MVKDYFAEMTSPTARMKVLGSPDTEEVVEMQTFQNPQPPQPRFFHMPRFNSNFQKTNNYFNLHQYKQHIQQGQNVEFDGKRLRKAVVRKTIDYNSAIIKQLQARVWQRDFRDQPALQPDCSYYTELVPPIHVPHNPINAVTTKFVRTSTNKMRCPIFCVAWTPEGRRLVTGASSGEFTLWNGLTFNFETILQAHDSPVRCMVWSHNDMWMVTGDHSGYVKYWQSNMNNVKMFQSHKEPLRGISFCPTDQKFATCSDDGTVRIWDFLRCHEEKILRGHGADVKCVDWHPQKGLIVSGSKDSQQPIKLWDPKNGQSIATLHAHKSTVMEVRWNQNGNWMLTASRDHLVKMFDIRNLNQDVQTFRGHKKEVCSLAWHPSHESLFTSGGSDGSVMFWVAGADKEVGAMEQAHDSIVWSLAWHPLGHILCSGSNDHSSKFWTRNRPGDKMRDKYNLNVLPSGGAADEAPEYDEPSSGYVIPGMGLDQTTPEHGRVMEEVESEMDSSVIPGLDFGSDSQNMYADKPSAQKKVPYAKPIPRQFQQQWLENKRPLLAAPPKDVSPTGEIGPSTEAIPNPSDLGSPHVSDPRVVDPRGVDPRAADPRGVNPRAGDPRGVDPRGVDPRGVDPRGVDPRGVDPRGVDLRTGDPRGVDPRSGDPRGVDPRSGDPRGVDPRSGDPRGVDPRSGDPRGVDPRSGDPRGVDPRAGDPRGVDPRGVDPRGVDPRSGDPRSAGLNQNALHSRTQLPRGDGASNNRSHFTNDFRNRGGSNDDFQDVDQRKYFPDQYSGNKRDYGFGDNDFRNQDSRNYGTDRSMTFVPNQQRPDDGIRMHPQPYQDYDSRDFGPGGGGGGGRGPPPRSSNQPDCGPRDYGDCDLRVRDDDRRVPPSAEGGGDKIMPMDNPSYGNRKRGWDDGPNDQRPYYGSSRDDMYSESYGDKSGSRGRSNSRGGRARGAFRGRGRNARSYQ